MNAAMDPRASDVLDFWFGTSDTARDEWFRKDPAFDARIRERFGPLVEQALAGALTDWNRAPDGALAQVLLLDQFTRNIHRGSALAFAGDRPALALAQSMVGRGDDAALPPLRRVFVYLPFEHAEDAAAQRESLRLFAALAAAHPALEPFNDYARRHAEVIERFGRFPHRNAVLGRASTAEELAYLSQPGSGF
jgi:uncharacterized protein (DUF924 family)